MSDIVNITRSTKNKGESMSRKKIKTIINEKISPFELNEKGISCIAQLVRKYPYELLVECIDIGVSTYFKYDDNGNLTKESVQIFLDKLGGIVYNKSRSPIDQAINHLKNKGNAIFPYWDFIKADKLLYNYVNELKLFGWSEVEILSDLQKESIHMMDQCQNWSQWCENMEKWIDDIKNWDSDITVDQFINDIKQWENSEKEEQLETVLPSIIFDNLPLNIQSLCKQINVSYENSLYDCTAVIMRRLLKGLLILTYQKNNIEFEILVNSENCYISLNEIIKDAVKNQILSFSTITKENIVLFEDLGKYSTHEIWYNYTQQDIKQLIIKYRKIIEELICKAGLVQKGN